MSPTAVDRIRVLHVEPDADFAHIVQSSLAQCGRGNLEFVRLTSLDAASVQLVESEFDVVLLEPFSSDGEAFLQNIREVCARANRTAVVVLTANVDESLAIKSMDLGVQDYLIKGQADSDGIFNAIQFAIQRSGHQLLAAGRKTTKNDGALKILLVEDNPGDALLIEESLSDVSDSDCDVTIVNRLDKALHQLSLHSFNAAVLDLSLPDSRGFEACAALHQQSPEIPFVVHTGSHDSSLALKSIQHGASDFLVKGRASGRDLVRSIRFAIRRQLRGDSIEAPVSRRSPGSRTSRRTDSAQGSRQSQTTGASQRFSTDPTRRVASPTEHRTSERYQVVRSALVIPICPGGRPEWERRLVAVTSDLSRDDIGLELEAVHFPSQDYMIGVERRDGVLCYAGLTACRTETTSPRRLRVAGTFGGRGQTLLALPNLTPNFDPVSLRLTHAIAVEVLADWCRVDVLRPILVDRVQVCPQCSALPTIRSGCKSCGSGRITSERLIHHFACAHVGPVGSFEHHGDLVCPKCRARRLIIGSDFEYQSGVVRCQDCHWNGTDLEQVYQCLRCRYRFPGGRASTQELTAYHVHRLDPMAIVTAS